jgi:hypothetical protein
MSLLAYRRMLIKSPSAQEKMIELLDDPLAFMKTLMASDITRKDTVLDYIRRFRWGSANPERFMSLT